MKLVISPEQVAAAKSELASRHPAKPLQRLQSGTIPCRILARIRKQGPMAYSEISAYIAGTRMIRRDKYVDPAIYSLRRRGFIELSKAPGCRGRWSITQAGRLALRDAKPTMDAILRERRKAAEQDQARHAAHVAVQRLMGLPEELIHGGLPDAMPVSGR